MDVFIAVTKEKDGAAKDVVAASTDAVVIAAAYDAAAVSVLSSVIIEFVFRALLDSYVRIRNSK